MSFLFTGYFVAFAGFLTPCEGYDADGAGAEERPLLR